jgi:hypothetical protein
MVDEMEKAIKEKKGGGKPPLDSHAAVRMQQEADQRANEAAAADRVESARIAHEIAERYKEQEKLRPMPPITQCTAARVARPDDEMVLMFFPRPMFIWAEPNEQHRIRHKVAFGRGIQEVPESMKDDWYLKANGVEEVDLPKKRESEKSEDKKPEDDKKTDGDKKPEDVKS